MKREIEKRVQAIEAQAGVGCKTYVLKIQMFDKTLTWLMLDDGSSKGQFIRDISKETAN